jgi:hypothetical protein
MKDFLPEEKRILMLNSRNSLLKKEKEDLEINYRNLQIVLTNSQNENQTLQSALTSCQNEKNNLATNIAEYEDVLSKLRAHLHKSDIERELEIKENELQEVYKSLSWRLICKLRQIYHRFPVFYEYAGRPLKFIIKKIVR